VFELDILVEIVFPGHVAQILLNLCSGRVKLGPDIISPCELIGRTRKVAS
jgi:hypothetical protein